jgi:hypothetical protein
MYGHPYARPIFLAPRRRRNARLIVSALAVASGLALIAAALLCPAAGLCAPF